MNISSSWPPYLLPPDAEATDGESFCEKQYMKDQGDEARATGPALEAMHRFILWLIPMVEKFPRSQKFFLGDRIQSTALASLERLIEATNRCGR
jgi:hypothetical protein